MTAAGEAPVRPEPPVRSGAADRLEAEVCPGAAARDGGARAERPGAAARLQAAARLAAAGAVGLGRLAARLAADRLARRGTPALRLAGEELARACERLGATYLKIAQVLGSRPDLLPPELVAPLGRLQDRVRPLPAGRAEGVVRRALGPRAEELLAFWDPEPVGSGSVAQVHRARLADGGEVAVKVLRPGVASRVAADFALLGALAATLERLPPLRQVPLAGLLGEVRDCVERQLDLARELRSLERLRTSSAGAEVRMARPVPRLSTAEVLTMELLGDLRKVGRSGLSADERRRAALAGLRALYKMIFLDGFIHADLHPGNVFVRRWGEVVLVDTGLVAELDDDDRLRFVDFFYGMVTNDGASCARVLLDTASGRARRFEAERFTADLEALIDRHWGLRADRFEVAAFAYRLFAVQRRHGLRGSTRFTMAILSLVVFEGIVKQLAPDLDFQAEARPYLIAARYRRRQAG